MHTLTVQVQDNFMQEFLNFIKSKKESIYIETDENLKYDPYFYERQKELHQIRDDIKNSKIKMVSHENVWNTIHNHLKTIDT
ncbi:MAG: hypothetical protein U9N52_07325 [Campylobacterota bacterium]|nr:hypothetical protein [Campylobacterota bacterium]